MKHCLSERALLDCVLGAADAAAQAHLRECADCAERHALLEEELADVATVLRHPPRVRRAARVSWAIPNWVTTLLVFALAGIATLVLVHTQRIHPPAPTAADSGTFQRDLLAALFAGPSLSSLPLEPQADTYLEAALEGGWPCTDLEAFDGRCAASLYSVLDDE